jgi:hypothetical protein
MKPFKEEKTIINSYFEYENHCARRAGLSSVGFTY